ncbi:MAG: hypothetical protein RR227_02400 [Oscillospiraceae bacterium]
MKIFNRKTNRVVCVALSGLMLAGVMGQCFFASAGDKKTDADTLQDSINSAVSSISEKDKEETVYVISDANGNQNEVIVSEWLKNSKSSAILKDYTDLRDINNTNGDETFENDGKGNLSWNAAGSDIHYRGASDKQLPVKVQVSYYLDNVKIEPAQLANKSGHVKIHFDYENTAKHTSTVNGKKTEVYVPFLVASGVILDNENFSNVSVTKGAVVDDGSRNIIVGCALPGMAESLNVTADDIDIPDSVDIEADTTNFVLSTTLTMAMPGLTEDLKLDENGKLDDLSGSMSALDSAAQELIAGTTQLYDGISTLYDKCGQLQSGSGALLSGSQALSAGVLEANKGAQQLSGGLSALSANSSAINGGALQVVNAVFASATAQIRTQLVSSGMMSEEQANAITLTPSNYSSVFAQFTSSAEAAAEAQLRSALGAMDTDHQNLAMTIASDLVAAGSGVSVTQAVSTAAGMMQNAAIAQTACAAINDEWLANPAISAAIAQAVEASGKDSETAAKLVAVALALDSSNPTGQIEKAGTVLESAAKVAGTSADPAKISSLCLAAASSASAQGEALVKAKASLDGVMGFYNGLSTYTAGVDSACSGSQKLAAGVSALKDGSQKLLDGINTLNDGNTQLIDGVSQLKDGSVKLSEGTQRFYDEGIKKLIGAFKGNYGELTSRLQAIKEAGQSYKSFGGISPDMSGLSKFVIKTASVG